MVVGAEGEEGERVGKGVEFGVGGVHDALSAARSEQEVAELGVGGGGEGFEEEE